MNWDATLSNVPRGWTNNRIHFFKYMSESTAKAVLRNQTLRWSTAATLNDPFEMQLNVTIEGIDVDKVKKRALEKIWELYSSDQQVPIGNQLGVALEFMTRACQSENCSPECPVQLMKASM